MKEQRLAFERVIVGNANLVDPPTRVADAKRVKMAIKPPPRVLDRNMQIPKRVPRRDFDPTPNARSAALEGDLELNHVTLQVHANLLGRRLTSATVLKVKRSSPRTRATTASAAGPSR